MYILALVAALNMRARTCWSGTVVAIVSRPTNGEGPRGTFELSYISDGRVRLTHDLGTRVSYGVGGNLVATLTERPAGGNILTLWNSANGDEIEEIPIAVALFDTLNGAPARGIVISSDASTAHVLGVVGNVPNDRPAKLVKVTLATKLCEPIKLPDRYNMDCWLFPIADGFGCYLQEQPLFLFSARLGKFLPPVPDVLADFYTYAPGVGVLGVYRGSLSLAHGASADDDKRPHDFQQTIGPLHWAIPTTWGATKVVVFGTGEDNAGATEVDVFDPKKDIILSKFTPPAPLVNGVSPKPDILDFLSADGKLWRLGHPTDKFERFGDLGLTTRYARRSRLIAAN